MCINTNGYVVFPEYNNENPESITEDKNRDNYSIGQRCNNITTPPFKCTNVVGSTKPPSSLLSNINNCKSNKELSQVIFYNIDAFFRIYYSIENDIREIIQYSPEFYFSSNLKLNENLIGDCPSFNIQFNKNYKGNIGIERRNNNAINAITCQQTYFWIKVYERYINNENTYIYNLEGYNDDTNIGVQYY
jgi:hypothetical protein